LNLDRCISGSSWTVNPFSEALFLKMSPPVLDSVLSLGATMDADGGAVEFLLFRRSFLFFRCAFLTIS
jgi:hypothetical protein